MQKVRRTCVFQGAEFATPRGQVVPSVRLDQVRRTWLDWSELTIEDNSSNITQEAAVEFFEVAIATR